MKIASILLAAGQGTRMHSKIPKVLHPVVGRPMIFYAVEAVQRLVNLPPVVIVGYGSDAVRQALSGAGFEVQFALQEQQLGTAHAISCAQSLLEKQADQVLVTCADMPLLQVETLQRLITLHAQSGGVMTMTSVIGEVPRGFGRVVRDEHGGVSAIVEEAVATPEQLAIREYNVSAYCFEAAWLWENLKEIQLSAKKEYYLTDLVEIAVKQGYKVETLVVPDPAEALGINTRVDLAAAEHAMRLRINQRWMIAGVTLLDPDTTTIEVGVTIGQDTTIYPNTALRGSTVIGEDCHIGPDTTLVDTEVGDATLIQNSVAEYARVGNHVSIGPFCHLRKGAILLDGVHMGNFGEVKASTLGENVKMGHFSYIGDAKVGSNVNIGAGTITCNFDGEKKNLTEIGENAFIGSDTMLVAPVKIGKNARTGAGSVVTHDVPDNELVYGVPAREAKEKK
jgi:bifunctional UDP-N-acetylglucosamine pyrophosphorylase/glucosamine-1-phosphate N-acetyltransferase